MDQVFTSPRCPRHNITSLRRRPFAPLVSYDGIHSFVQSAFYFILFSFLFFRSFAQLTVSALCVTAIRQQDGGDDRHPHGKEWP
jgi:hypothetical protein